MDNLPRQTLCELIAKYGESLCDDPSRCEGLLRDFCGRHRLEINVLIDAIKERIPTDLCGSLASVPIEISLTRLTQRLQQHRGLPKDLARWAVESWALALGKIAEKDLAPQTAAGAALSSWKPGGSETIGKQSISEPEKRKTWLWSSSVVAAAILLGAVILAIVLKQNVPIVVPVTPTPVQSETPSYTTAPERTAAPVPTETPSYMATATPLPTITEYEAQTFVNTFYRTVESKDLASVLSLYEENVNYFDNGRRDRAFIRDDYIKYYKRWPSVSFAVGSVRVSNSASDNTAAVSFEIQFSVRDPSSNRSRNGRASEEWTIAKSYGALKITSHQETVYPDASAVPSAPSSGDTEIVRQFVRDYYSALARRDINGVLANFDNVVNYQGNGKRGQSFIRADLYKYVSKWTSLNFNLGSITVSQASDGRFVVSFTYDYSVSNGSQQKGGQSSNNWVLRVIQGHLRIISQEESVRRR